VWLRRGLIFLILLSLQDEDGVEHNLLMDAIIVENEKFAKLLIEKGADVTYTV